MLTQFLNLLATIISVISLLIVTYGALIAIISFIINELKRITGAYTPTNIRKLRAVFGTYLLLGLEFLIASDILKTVLEPTMNELIILGGIVVVRTILSVFLNKEIKELEPTICNGVYIIINKRKEIGLMNTEKEKTSSEEQKKAEKVLKDKVPVQQTGTYSEATKKEVRDAVKELNPDMSGLDRG